MNDIRLLCESSIWLEGDENNRIKMNAMQAVGFDGWPCSSWNKRKCQQYFCWNFAKTKMFFRVNQMIGIGIIIISTMMSFIIFFLSLPICQCINNNKYYFVFRQTLFFGRVIASLKIVTENLLWWKIKITKKTPEKNIKTTPKLVNLKIEIGKSEDRKVIL